MTTEIRACKDQDELKKYGEIVSYVFASTDGMDDELSSTQPDWTTCGFIDGKMVATMGTFPFTVRLNGSPVKMGGVTAVGTLPEHRRKGLLRKIMQQGFNEMRDRGQSIAILWASMGAIYQRFGYGLMTTQVSYNFDPRYVAFEGGSPATGSVTMTPKDDAWPIIKQLYIQYVAPRNLQIHRATAIWEADQLRPRKKGEPVFIGIYRNGDGEATGYLVYKTFEREGDGYGPGQVMEVTDLVALDMDAYRGLWEYIRRHDLVGKVSMRNIIGEEDPAPHLLSEPRMLDRRTSDAIWGRVVDLEMAIPQRPYGDRGELAFSIPEDRMCPWNEGNWLLETDSKTTSVRKTDRTPDLVMPVNTLAGLLAGHRTATNYQRVGKLDSTSDAALKTANRIFATEYAPHCSNHF